MTYMLQNGALNMHAVSNPCHSHQLAHKLYMSKDTSTLLNMQVDVHIIHQQRTLGVYSKTAYIGHDNPTSTTAPDIRIPSTPPKHSPIIFTTQSTPTLAHSLTDPQIIFNRSTPHTSTLAKLSSRWTNAASMSSSRTMLCWGATLSR